MTLHSFRSSIFRRHALLVVVAIVSSRASLLGHDMWIDPTAFSPDSGQIVGVRLRVGQDLLGDPLPRDPALINQFIFEDAAGRKPLVGRDGADPAGFLRVAMPGLLVIGYRSNPSAVELTAEKFNQYLKEEGLDAVAALRARRNDTGAKAREIFGVTEKGTLRWKRFIAACILTTAIKLKRPGGINWRSSCPMNLSTVRSDKTAAFAGFMTWAVATTMTRDGPFAW